MPNASDLAASNQLKISILVISNAQAWKNQIRGVYTLLYPHAIKDFVHLDDYKVWRDKFDRHIHGNGNNGSPTTIITIPILFNTQKAKSLVQTNDAVGSIRKGFNQAKAAISKLDEFNKKKV